MSGSGRCGEGPLGGDGAARVWPRLELLRNAVAGITAVAGAALLARADAVLGAGAQQQDVRVLNLMLQLEYTEAAFYAEAIRNASLGGDLLAYAQTAERHEQEHVRFLRQALGGNAVESPRFDFAGTTQDPDEFTRAAIDLEDLAVAGYNGQATNLSPATLAAAARIVSVEARHAGWIRALAGRVAAPEPVDEPITAAALERGLRRIGMLA
jgi:hypothetical protein